MIVGVLDQLYFRLLLHGLHKWSTLLRTQVHVGSRKVQDQKRARAELAYSFCREAAELAHLERFEEAEKMAARQSSSHVSQASFVTTRGIMELWDGDLAMICMHTSRCPSMSCPAATPCSSIPYRIISPRDLRYFFPTLTISSCRLSCFSPS